MAARQFPSMLLLARHYPPAISGGARRPYLLTQGLRNLGARVFVVAPSLPDGEASPDMGLVVPHPNRDPQPGSGAEHKKTARDFARDWLLWPDPDIRWCMRAAKAAEAVLPWPPDWVWTTSPPESAHAAGAYLKRRLKARWLADFRDTWLDRPHRQDRRALHRRIGETIAARWMLPAADLVSAVDPVVAADAQRLGARAPKVLAHFAPNAFPAPAKFPTGRVHIVHAGSIELSDPQCRIEDLLQPFAKARVQNPDLMLHLVGRLSAREAALAVQSEGVTAHGPTPYERALSCIAGADALIFVASGKMHVPPSKIVEYLATDKPIIACGQGPWRQDPRTPKGDPIAEMATLKPGVRRSENLPRPMSAQESAAELLGWLRVGTVA